jgi:hypothetical protein
MDAKFQSIQIATLDLTRVSPSRRCTHTAFAAPMKELERLLCSRAPAHGIAPEAGGSPIRLEAMTAELPSSHACCCFAQ